MSYGSRIICNPTSQITGSSSGSGLRRYRRTLMTVMFVISVNRALDDCDVCGGLMIMISVIPFCPWWNRWWCDLHNSYDNYYGAHNFHVVDCYVQNVHDALDDYAVPDGFSNMSSMLAKLFWCLEKKRLISELLTIFILSLNYKKKDVGLGDTFWINNFATKAEETPFRHIQPT